MAEGGGLLNRYRVKSSIGGSNPPLSASSSKLYGYGPFTGVACDLPYMICVGLRLSGAGGGLPALRGLLLLVP